MKKSITYSFWLATAVLTASVFTFWANYFQGGSLAVENPKHLALNIPASPAPKNSFTTHSAQNVIPQSTQNMQTTKPVSARKTKTS